MQEHSSFHAARTRFLHVAGLLQCKYTLLSSLPLVAAGDYAAHACSATGHAKDTGTKVSPSPPPPPPPPPPGFQFSIEAIDN